MATPRTGRPRGRPKRIVLPDDGSKPSGLPEQAWRCIVAEFAAGGIGEASLADIGKRGGITKEAVRRWRGKELYQRGFHWLVREWQRPSKANRLPWEDDLPESTAGLPKVARQVLETEIRRRARAKLPEFVEAHWFGATRSPINDIIYTSAQAYTTHLLVAPNWPLPVQLIQEVQAELRAEANRIRLAA
jgi:hypothetical protein